MPHPSTDRHIGIAPRMRRTNVASEVIWHQVALWSLGWRRQLELATALVAALVAVWGWIPGPARLPGVGASLPASGAAARSLPTWLVRIRGRPDGVSERFRTVLAIPAALGVAITAQAVGMPWWLAWLCGVVAATTGWVLLGQVEADDHRRRRMWLVSDLPAACDLLAVCLDAGLPLRQACGVVTAAMPGPIAEDLGRVDALIAAGTHEPDAWRRLADVEPWRRLVTDLARSVDSGAAVADVLHHHAEEARTAAELARELRARTAGVRSVLPLMLCFLPAFFLVGVVPLVASLVLRMLG